MKKNTQKELQGTRILVVEDSPTQAKKLQHLLIRQGSNVFLAANGKQALTILEKEKIDIVISDVIMPEMDGFELCKIIKSKREWADIPVVLLTSLKDPKDIIRGLKSGADNFLTKPYDPEFLLKRMKYIIINRQLRQKGATELGMEIFFAGEKFFLSSERIQIVDLLLSTYEAAVKKSLELEEANKKLKKALNEIKTLHGLIPICANCKKVRNDQGYWQMVEEYVSEHSDVTFSHGICPDCYKKLYGNRFSNKSKKIK